MALYNLTNVTGSNNFLTMTQAVNVMSEGYFGILLYFCILIIFFIGLKTRSQARTTVVFAITAWFGMIINVILTQMKMLPSYFWTVNLLLAIGMIVAVFVQEQPGD